MKKYSRKREAILKVLMNTNTHPTAAWVYEQLKPDYPDLSLATVYRNIAEFVKDGVVVSVSNVNGQERYDATVEPHTHFICVRCNKVIDLPQYNNKNLDLKVASETGLKIERHELIFKGLCKECAC